jgi:alpha-N-arabinofuranosidase
MNSHNTFTAPNAVAPKSFEGIRAADQAVRFTLPAKSIVVIEMD